MSMIDILYKHRDRSKLRSLCLQIPFPFHYRSTQLGMGRLRLFGLEKVTE